jgi:hypothetical protein
VSQPSRNDTLVAYTWFLLLLLAAILALWGALLGRRRAIAVADDLIPVAIGRYCVFSLDLTRVLGVVVWGVGESFAGPRSLRMTTISRAMHLLGSAAARPLLLWILKFW